MKHSMILDKRNDPTNEIWTCFNITEIGPPNRPDLHQLRIMKQILSDIPHSRVTHNWWSDMSEGRTAINRGLKLLKFTSAFVDEIDNIGNIAITIKELSPTIFQKFIIHADIEAINRSEDIAAYNVARVLLDNNNLEEIQLPRSLNKLVATFLDIY